MSHPLEHKMAALRRLVRWMAAVRAASLVVAALVGAGVAAGLLDYLVRLQDHGLRVMASAFVCGSLAWAFRRHALGPLRARLRDVDLARRVQRLFPALDDRLASAVEFLGRAQNDPSAGSASLRAAVVARVTAEVQPLDFRQVIDRRPTLRAAGLLAVALAIVAAIVVVDPSSSRIAVARLANPFSRLDWPRPSDLRTSSPLPVRLLAPPGVESVALRLIPPAYTGRPTTTAEHHIRALVGTRVEVAGQATKPLRAATLCIEGGRRIPATIGADGRTFTIASHDFIIEKSGPYWFELTDRDGLVGGADDRWEIQTVPDLPPTVAIERPTADLFVTPQAVVPLRVVAKDDLALGRIEIAFRRVERPQSHDRRSRPVETMTLADPRPTARSNSRDTSAQGDRCIVEVQWNLGPLGLAPGTQVTFWATTTDLQPQSGKSDPRSLTVVTLDEMRNRVAERQTLILAELARAMKLQQACRDQVQTLGARLLEPKPLAQAVLDGLQVVEHSQRDAADALAGRERGVPSHVAALLADLDNNRLPTGDLRGRMSALGAEIDRLAAERLPAIDRQLAAAAKSIEIARAGQGGGARAAKPITDTIHSAARHQDAVLDAIRRQIKLLTPWDSQRRFHRALDELARDQDDLAGRTTDLSRRTLTQDPRDLAAPDAAALSAASSEQLDLAGRLDRLLQEMRQAAPGLREDDPVTAAALLAALDDARDAALPEQMRSAASRIERNQMGQATAQQRQIGRDLRRLLDALAGPRRSSGDGPSDQDLGRVAQEMARLRERQGTLLAETQRLDAAGRSEPAPTRAHALAVLDAARSQRAIHADAARIGEPLAGDSVLSTNLAAAIEAMHRAAALLDDRRTGDTTQDAQRDALTAIDRLLAVAKDAAARLANAEKQPSQSANSAAKQPGAAEPSVPAAESKSPGGAPAASPEDIAARRSDAETTRARMKRVWGQLPEGVRRQIRDLPADVFLPGYERLIEEYYRRLSEAKEKP